MKKRLRRLVAKSHASGKVYAWYNPAKWQIDYLLNAHSEWTIIKKEYV